MAVQKREPVGFVGLGTMGRPMAQNLARAGFPVVVWNRNVTRAAELAAAAGAGVVVARTLAELGAAAPVVLTMLPDLPQVEAVLGGSGGMVPRPEGPQAGSTAAAGPRWIKGFGGHVPRPEGPQAGSTAAAGPPDGSRGSGGMVPRPEGLLAGMRPGSVLVVLGTVSPVGVRELGERLDAAGTGVALVDAPVSGGDVGAEQGTLSIMAGGADADVARVRPYLEAMGTTVDHLGSLGAGQLAKACNQIVVGATITALSEAVVLARRGGLDPARVLGVLAGGLADSRVLELKGSKMLRHDFQPGGAAAFQHKDLGFALAVARAEGVALPLTALVDQLFGAACWNGFGGDDHSVLLRVIEQLAGERDASGASGATPTPPRPVR